MELNKSLQIVDTKKVAMDYDKSIVPFYRFGKSVDKRKFSDTNIDENVWRKLK